MRCEGVVAASDLPVHRDIYGDAAVYFNTYEPADLARVVDGLLGEGAQARRDALREAGERVSASYLPECVLPQWQDFLHRLSRQSPGA